MKKKTVRIIAIFMVLITVFVMMPTSRVMAKTAEERLQEAKEALAALEEEKKLLDAERADAKTVLDGFRYQETTIREQIDSLNTELETVAANLEEINGNMKEKEEEIAKTGEELAIAKENESTQYAAMESRVKYLYENSGTDNYLNLFLEAENFGQILNLAEYMNMLAEYDNKLFSDYKELREKTEETEKQLQAEHAELEVIRQAGINEQNRLTGLIEEHSVKMQYYLEKVNTASQELAQIDAEVKQKQQEMDEQEDDIEQIKREIELSKISAAGAKRDISEIVFDANDRYLLANLIYCEAGGEPYEGQVAVGAVVINRVRSSVFPDTVTSVIYQKRQFAPVNDGHLALALAQNRATESCYRAADEAMAGYSNVGDCVYFRTIIPGINGIIIGNHIFY